MRVDTPTCLVLADWTRRFRAGDFPAPAPAPAPAAAPAGGRDHALHGRVVTAAPALGLDIADLPPGGTDRIKAMIVQGSDPEGPGRYESRSEAYWAVICALVRAKCTDAQMMGLIPGVTKGPPLGVWF